MAEPIRRFRGPWPHREFGHGGRQVFQLGEEWGQSEELALAVQDLGRRGILVTTWGPYRWTCAHGTTHVATTAVDCVVRPENALDWELAEHALLGNPLAGTRLLHMLVHQELSATRGWDPCEKSGSVG